MHLVSGGLKRVRGETISISTHRDATVDELLPLAIEKHCACNWKLARGDNYVLLYPHGQKVDTLPGSDVPFTLAAYRDFMGKAYQKLVLFLCKEEDIVTNDSNEEDEIGIREEDSRGQQLFNVLYDFRTLSHLATHFV